jgi:uncharacterized protein (DUF2384 family)
VATFQLGRAPRTMNRMEKANDVLSAGEREEVLRATRVRNLAPDLFPTDKAVSEWRSHGCSHLRAAGGSAPVG